MISIEDCVELAIRDFKVYIHCSDERLIQPAIGDKLDTLQASSILKTKKKEGWL